MVNVRGGKNITKAVSAATGGHGMQKGVGGLQRVLQLRQTARLPDGFNPAKKASPEDRFA